jgi:hypothetical protein
MWHRDRFGIVLLRRPSEEGQGRSTFGEEWVAALAREIWGPLQTRFRNRVSRRSA